MAKNTRIPIPGKKDTQGVLALAMAILARHQQDGADSPIRGQLKADFEAVIDDIIEGLKEDAEAKALARKLEALFERRNNRVGRVHPLLPRISKALQSEYGPLSLRRMGDHGFTVNDSPPSKKDNAA